MKKHTTMRVTNVTKNRLKELAYTQGEPMENILIRLLESKCGTEKVFYIIKTDDEEFQLKISVDWSALTKNLYYYDENDQIYINPPIPNFSDEDKAKRYELFIEKINDIPNIHAMLVLLSEGQFIRAGDLVIERLK